MQERSLVGQINDELIRLGYSSFTGNNPGWLAAEEGAGIVMAHPTKPYDVALYDGARLLAALRALGEAPTLADIRGALQQAQIG